MHDRPSGEALAGLAEALGARGVLADRCFAIAAYEAAAGEGAFAACRAALIERYGEGDDAALLTRLADDIRAGALDEGSKTRAALAQALRAITQEKLRARNPAYRTTIRPR